VRGYAYYVALKGVTGAKSLNTDEVAQRLQVIRRHVRLPIGVGFGISDVATAQRVARVADAVVIGSKLVETIEAAVVAARPQEKETAAIVAAGDWLRGIRQALDQIKGKAAR
jgi:tryptophan synthase alpha chain